MDLDLNKIPHKPGCYLFLDESKKPIYVGKAKDLKKRVASYFNQDLDVKTSAMISQAKNFDFIVTKNEIEALILENNLIKKNSPKYNINLKDSKRYAYLEITKEKFPRLLVARKTISDGKLFGPFTSAQNRDYVRDILIKTFKIRTCKNLPKKACLRKDIGLCEAPCVGKQSENDYNQNVKAVEMVLRGKNKKLIYNLGKSMMNYSNVKDYENALKYRDKIRALKFLEEKQVMERQKQYDEDIINYLKIESKIVLFVFNINHGILENKQEFEFEFKENFLEEFLIQFYSESRIPREIIIPEKVDENIIKYLKKLRGKDVRINIPIKGDKKELLEMVKKNIEIQFFGEFEKLEELQNKLNLQEIPEVIECFDISHLSGSETVGSMVQFRKAKPDKTNYRKFKIKSVEGIDDFAAIGEVVRRRYFGLLKNKENLPNLIVIDGGLGQLHYALNELKNLNLKIPIISLAKKEEEIYLPNGKILKLDKKNKGLLLLIAIRDEAHRFAIKFHRERRKKKMFEDGN